MKTVDDFLRDVFSVKTRVRSDEFANEYNYDHRNVIDYMNKIESLNKKWISLFTRTVEGPVFFRLNYEDYEIEIEEFLSSGGFRMISKAEGRKENIEIENLALIKAQQKEIEDNKARQRTSTTLSIVAIVISVLALLVQYLSEK